MANNVMNMDGSFKPFRFWCQHVLPQVYDDSLSYMELLNKVIVYINSFGEYLEEFTAINEVKYGGPWDVTKQYTPNTVVSVGDTGYMSIKPVPAGIDIHNTDYWLQVADFAGQVVDLGVRVIALENAMTEAENDIDTLETKMSTAETNISGLNTRLTSAETEITNDAARITKISRTGVQNNARNILFIGDSYSIFLSDSTLNYPYLTASYLGCQHTLNGYGGSGFVGTTDKTFDDLLTEAPSGDYSDIVFGGGYNDRLVYYGDLQASVLNTINHAKTLYPNANIWVINMGASIDSDVKYTLLTPCAVYKEAAKVSNARYFDISNTLSMRSVLAMDGVHPGGNGQAALAVSLANVLKGGNDENTQPLTSTTITRGDGISTSLATFAQHGNHCVLKINYGVCTLSEAISMNCDGQHPIELASIDNTNIMGGSWTPIYGFIYVRADCDNVSQHFYEVHGQFTIHDQKLIFTPLQIKDNSNGYGGTAWLSLTNVQIILMTGCEIVFHGDNYIQ